MDELLNTVFESEKLFDYSKLLRLLSLVESRGDVLVMKMDGARESNKYTVVLLSGHNKFESIRMDSASLYTALQDVFKRYNKKEDTTNNLA